MISEKNVMRGAVLTLVLAVAAIGYNQRGARADGIPAMQPMTYAGTLEEGNGAVSGTRNLRLTIWDDATSTESMRSRCVTSAQNTMVNNGRFQVTLDNACTAAIRSTPNLWLEIEVNGTSLGRTKLSAVPFAVESGRAAELTPTAANNLVPPGTVVAFAGESAPPGWLLCDGAPVSQSMYPALFAAIGTAHGNGGMSGRFNLPDLRGRFVRGVDRGVMPPRNPGRASRIAANPGGNAGDSVGSIEAAGTAMPTVPFVTASAGTHSHGGSTGQPDGERTTNPARNYGPMAGPNRGFAYTFSSTFGDLFMEHVHTIAPDGSHSHPIMGGDNETRPTNIGLNYIIRY
jgi:Phage Tail Collar Domain